jgi:carbohydrate-selective porin OprB
MKNMRYSFGLGAVALALAVSGVCSSASAQGTGGPAVPSASPFDSVIQFGQSLAKQGIYLNLSYNEDVSSLVAGGQKTGTMPIGQAAVGAVFDLETILGITGASVHITIDERNGEPIGTYGGIAGTGAILQADAGPIKYRLSDLYWEQGFDHDRLDIKAGWTQPTFDFDFSDVSCTFVSSYICAQPGSWYLNNPNQPFGTGELGTRVNYQLTPHIYVRAGLYDDDPSQGGFMPAGTNWNIEHSVGAFVPVEVGYKTGFKDSQYPSNFLIGGYEDTSNYVRPNGVSGSGRQAFYARVEQTVWRPNQATRQSLTLFADGILYSGNAPFYAQYDAGFLDRAPFGAARPGDTVAGIVTLFEENTGIGYLPNGSGQELAFELNYGAKLIPGVTFKPYLQYVVNPSNPAGVYNSAGSQHLANDVSVGFQVAINVSEMFDLPEFIAH